MKLVDKILKGQFLYTAENCPPFLKRWTLIPSWITRLFGKDCGVFLHRILSSDKDLHDHPARFVSIGIKGRYIDITPNGEKIFKAPWIRTFPANYIHRIHIHPQEKAWTIVVIFPVVREWGFWVSGVWTHWSKYMEHNKCPQLALT